ncbi:caspase family protein [Allocoleopsis sp.]|uniref:caspase family protein n=1 Tax=Allocoleopsis sp. TaxID=3088169 RepID=UPI002FD3711A
MSSIKRRKFLQLIGASTLSTLSLGQLDLPQGNPSAQALTQSTPRKLALLVGINAYVNNRRFPSLRGCLTDVELQRQLLIYRFGFNPQDILILTDTQATRQGILEAFEQHLIEQAQPGDVVVFHFSGYGSQIADPDCDSADCLNSTLVPVDSSWHLERSVPDIMGYTLWLLIAALKTENVTVVIDASHAGDIISSELGSSSPSISTGKSRSGSRPQPNAQEKAYQQQWLGRLSLSPSEFRERRRTGIPKGMLLVSSQREQLAADGIFSGFCAGTFTYLMTQYLWQQTGNEWARSAIANISRGLTPLSSTTQIPQLVVKSNSGNEKRPIYFLERYTPPAEAVITQIEGKTVKLWLGGIEPQSLRAFNQGATLTIVDKAGHAQGLIDIESRVGLVGVGKVIKASPKEVQVGALLQERMRGIPDQLTLRLGLDRSLGNNLAEAQQALQSIKFIEILSSGQGEIDYILGCITRRDRQISKQPQGRALPPIGSIGLLLPGRVLVPGSFGESGESAIAAINRLQPKFKSLLATRMVKLALNPNSSRLNVKAWMRQEDNPQGAIAQAFAIRGSSQGAVPGQEMSAQVEYAGTMPVLPIQKRVQLHIANHEPRPLYCSILVIDSTREISIIFPNQWAAKEEITRVEAGQTLLVPDPSKDNFSLVTQEPKGVAEVLIIASSKPLRKTLLSLRAIAQRGGQQRGPIALNAPNDSTDVVANLLDDLDTGNYINTAITVTNQSVRRLDTTQLAVMSILFEVV